MEKQFKSQGFQVKQHKEEKFCNFSNKVSRNNRKVRMNDNGIDRRRSFQYLDSII